MSKQESNLTERSTRTARGRYDKSIRWGLTIRTLEPMINDGVSIDTMAKAVGINPNSVLKLKRIRSQMLDCETFTEFWERYGAKIEVRDRALDMWHALFDDDYDDAEHEPVEGELESDRWRGGLPELDDDEREDCHNAMLWKTQLRDHSHAVPEMYDYQISRATVHHVNNRVRSAASE